MPIGSIISQPAADSIYAAYRPIVFEVSATATDGGGQPPVVYCDIYFNNIFYKTISKSQYSTLGGSSSNWQFDIQDAAQEYLAKYIGANGGTAIIVASPLVTLTKCLFRSSGFDTEGFIQQEGTPPVQGTGDTNPSGGTGTASNDFNIVNAALQHEDNQDLATHLEAYKQRVWDAGTFPLTHRPDHYKVCGVDSDYFPILSNKVPTKLRLHYKLKGDTDFTEVDGTTICVPVSFTDFTPPNAFADLLYDFSLPLSGSGPFSVSGITKPAWMTIAVSGSNLVFSGTPGPTEEAIHVGVAATVSNCSGGSTQSFSKFINVLPPCVGVTFGAITLPDATANVPYNYSVALSGTTPLAISGITKPAWMSIAVSGTNLVFSGTPAQSDADTGVAVQLTVTNCGGADDGDVDTTINILESQNYILSAAYNMSIDSVTGSGIPALAATGVNGNKHGHQTGMSGSYSVVISGTPALPTTKLDVYVNSGLVATVAVPAAGTYSVSVTATEDQQVAFFINS
jgi:hypothetical protein